MVGTHQKLFHHLGALSFRVSRHRKTRKVIVTGARLLVKKTWPRSHLHVKNLRLPDRRLDAAFLKVRDRLHAGELALVHELEIGRFSGGFGRFRLRGFHRLRGDAALLGGLGHCGRKQFSSFKKMRNILKVFQRNSLQTDLEKREDRCLALLTILGTTLCFLYL